MSGSTSDTGIDMILADLEPAIVRGQLNAAIKRLIQVFETTVELEGIQSGRRLIELVNLVSGERRRIVREVPLERRVST